jgi:hypothetical protein
MTRRKSYTAPPGNGLTSISSCPERCASTTSRGLHSGDLWLVTRVVILQAGKGGQAPTASLAFMATTATWNL